MDARLLYTSVGCNRTPQSADWYGELFAYGADRAIMLAVWEEVNVVCELNGLATRCIMHIYALCELPIFCGAQKEHLDTVFTALHGHKERVNCVKWITARKSGAASPPTLELLSGSVDKSVILWQRTQEVRGHNRPHRYVVALKKKKSVSFI